VKTIKSQTLFNSFFIIVSAVVFTIVAIRCATVPFCNDEAATFFHFIQSGNFLPYRSFVTANNHILNSCLARICFKLFGSSPFSLRLPNLLALLVLIVALYKTSKRLTYMHSKMLLTAGFLLAFPFLSFYSACRGYGISMSFLVLSAFYLMEYFNSKETKKLILFCLFMQIAVSANLTLIVVEIMLTFSVIIFQLFEKKFFKIKNILVLVVHSALILYWVKYSFFLQASNAFYIGQGENYFGITFVSLVQLLSGLQSRWIPICILCGFIVLLIFAITINLKRIQVNRLNLFTPSLFYSLMLAGIIMAFYGMKILLNTNYPEERTGLFFYVFFTLSFIFILDQFSGKLLKGITSLVIAGALIHFVWSINFQKHSSGAYITFPEIFYTRILEEQKLYPGRITIGGQYETKYVYAFWNYRHNGNLDTIDASYNNKIPISFTYIIAWNKDESYYKPYYDKIDFDKSWGLALFKRREN